MDTKEFLYLRKNACVGMILGKLERSGFWSELSNDEKEHIRKLIKTKVSSYHKEVLDLINAIDVGMQVNAIAVREKDKRR